MIPVAYAYGRVSRTDRNYKNLQVQLHEPAQGGHRRDLIFFGDKSGTTIERLGW